MCFFPEWFIESCMSNNSILLWKKNNKSGCLFWINNYWKIINLSVAPTHFALVISVVNTVADGWKGSLVFTDSPENPPKPIISQLFSLWSFKQPLFLLFETVEKTIMSHAHMSAIEIMCRWVSKPFVLRFPIVVPWLPHRLLSSYLDETKRRNASESQNML